MLFAAQFPYEISLWDFMLVGRYTISLWNFMLFAAYCFLQYTCIRIDASQWVRRYVYLRMTCLTWREHAVVIGGFSREFGLVARMWCKGIPNIEKGDSYWLWVKFAIFSSHTTLSGFFLPPLLLRWMRIESAFFSCDSDYRDFQLQPRSQSVGRFQSNCNEWK